MVVSISSTHNTGKTTLIESLKKETFFSKFNFIGSPTRKAKKEGMSINNQADNYDDTQLFCLQHDLEVISNYNRTGQHYILDRSLLDTYIYSKYLHRNNKVSDKVYLDVLDAWKQYHHIYNLFIVPNKNDVELVMDGDRIDDRGFRQDIHELFLVEFLDMKNILQVSGTTEQRIQQIKEYRL